MTTKLDELLLAKQKLELEIAEEYIKISSTHNTHLTGLIGKCYIFHEDPSDYSMNGQSFVCKVVDTEYNMYSQRSQLKIEKFECSSYLYKTTDVIDEINDEYYQISSSEYEYFTNAYNESNRIHETISKLENAVSEYYEVLLKENING